MAAYVAYAKSTNQHFYLGEVEADEEAQALALADERFHVRKDQSETLAVMPSEDWTGFRLDVMSRLKSMRQDHETHEIPLGAIVEVDHEGSVWGLLYLNPDGSLGERGQPGVTEHCIGPVGTATFRLYVVGHMRDCDGTPLYVLSSGAIGLPEGPIPLMEYRRWVTFVGNGYGADSLRDTGIRHPGFVTWDEYVASLQRLTEHFRG